MISAHKAQAIILEYARPIGTEEGDLFESLHRFLARPISAPIDLPSFANAAMDGFAVRSADTRSAGEKNPISLKVIGTIAAGDAPLTLHLNQRLQDPSPDSGEGPGGHGVQLEVRVVRIMTGAPIPDGADAVVPFEEIPPTPPLKKGGEGGFSDLIRISQPVVPGTNIRRAGEDVRKGEVVLQAGEKVTPRTIALLAALGLDRVTVFRKPRVAVISTGNELVEPGHPLAPGKIYNSNSPTLQAALQEIGLIPDAIVRSGDAEEELEKVIRQSLASVDVLITIGGVSAGDFDLVPKVLQKIGAKIAFHKVAIKPGKPLLFATFEKKLIFSLPGNPVSALMVFDRFIRPALLKMMGADCWRRPAQLAVAEETLKGTPGKEDYLRGIVERRQGAFFARSAGRQGSAQLATLARANATLIIPMEKERVASGEPVEFEFFSEGL